MFILEMIRFITFTHTHTHTYTRKDLFPNMFTMLSLYDRKKNGNWATTDCISNIIITHYHNGTTRHQELMLDCLCVCVCVRVAHSVYIQCRHGSLIFCWRACCCGPFLLVSSFFFLVNSFVSYLIVFVTSLCHSLPI